MKTLRLLSLALVLFAPSAHAGRELYVSSITGDNANPGTIDAPLWTLSAAIDALPVENGVCVAAIHLERGGTYDMGVDAKGLPRPLPIRSGANEADRFVIDAYGAGPRPVVLLRGRRGAWADQDGTRHALLRGLDFYGVLDDPAGDFYAPVHPKIGCTWRQNAPVENLRFEDCRTRFCELVLQYPRGVGTGHVTLRRCVILDSYELDGGLAQGLYTSGMGLLIDECVFDHNGWLEADGEDEEPIAEAIKYNHNAYVSHARDTTIRNCLFLRASSIGVKFTAVEPGSAPGIVVTDNLFVEGEIGVSIGGNQSNPLRFVGPRVNNNVFMHIGRALPTRRKLGWGIEGVDWDGGEVAGNVMLQQPIDVTNCFFIGFEGTARDVLVKDNFCMGLRGKRGALRLLPYPDGVPQQTGRVETNTFSIEGTAVVAAVAPDGWKFQGNRWSIESLVPVISNPTFTVAGQPLDEQGFAATAGEFKKPTPPPQVDVDLPIPFDELVARAREQGQTGEWDPAISAHNLNWQIRDALKIATGGQVPFTP